MKKILSVLLVFVLAFSLCTTFTASAAVAPTVTIKDNSHNMVVVAGETAKLEFYMTKTYEEQRLFFNFFDINGSLIASSQSGVIQKNGQIGHNHSITVDTAAIKEMVRGSYKLVYFVEYYSNGAWRSTGTRGTDYLYVVNKSDFIQEGDAYRYFYDSVASYETKLVKHEGKWYYLDKGLWTNVPTTLLKINGKWFFVEKGMWTAKTDLVKYQGKTFYVEGGKWDASVTDLKKVNGKWYYIQSGKWNNAIDTLHKINGKWFLIKKGMWNKTTGLVEYKGKTFYVVGGKWNSTVNTLYKKGSKYYAIKSGKLYEGKAIITYNGKKFYCNKGYAQLSFSGKVKIGSKTYTVKKGIVK